LIDLNFNQSVSVAKTGKIPYTPLTPLKSGTGLS